MYIKINKKIIASMLIFVLGMVFICVENLDIAHGAPIVEEPDDNSFETENNGNNPPAGELVKPDGSTDSTVNNNTGNAGVSGTSNRKIDTRLSELSIECGEMVPSFSPEQYSYTVYVSRENENKSCKTSATAMNTTETTISAEGPSEFSDKDIQKIIKVTGNDGSSSEYVINVHIIKDTELLVGTDLYSISETPDIDTLPGNFYEVEIEFKGEKIKAAKNQDDNLCLICFTNESDEPLWYMLSTDKKSLYPIKWVDYNGKQYIDISAIGMLTYGNNGNSEGYYLIDTDTGQVILDIGGNNNISETSGLIKNKTIIIALIMGGIALICLIGCIYLYNKNKKLTMAYDNQNRYFRPYIHLEDEQIEIIGEAETNT